MDVTPTSTEETHAAPDDPAPAAAVPSDEAETPRAVLGPAAAAAAQAMREAGAKVSDDATWTLKALSQGHYKYFCQYFGV